MNDLSMNLNRALLVTLVCTLLSACGGGGDDGSTTPPPNTGPGPATSLIIQAGNNQVITQHTYLPQALQVHVTDARGNLLPDVPVTFSAAPGSAYITPSSSNTDSNGVAAWNNYVHAANGQQIVQAESPGLPTAMFTIAVTPTSHPYDGVYDCKWFESSGAENNPGYLRIGIGDGVRVVNGSRDLINGGGYYAASFDESTGSINVVQRASLDYENSFTGTLVVGQDQRGTGSGTWVSLYHLQPLPPTDPGFGKVGTWNCQRE